MLLAEKLRLAIDSGICRIGQIAIRSNAPDEGFILCHEDDLPRPDLDRLEIHLGPAAARDLSTYGTDGSYRFTKGQVNLRSGWLMKLADAEELRLALDHFYPACSGLYFAWRDGTLEVENLRDKLNRQTGMYRFARSISDPGAQKLVQEICGPAHQCAKRILWQLDPATPLEDSEASRYNGIPGAVSEAAAIPLLCREACNHFVAECRKAAKAEFEVKSTVSAES